MKRRREVGTCGDLTADSRGGDLPVSSNYTRRDALRLFGACAGAGALAGLPLRSARADRYDAKTQETIRKGIGRMADALKAAVPSS